MDIGWPSLRPFRGPTNYKSASPLVQYKLQYHLYPIMSYNIDSKATMELIFGALQVLRFTLHSFAIFPMQV